MLRRLLSLLLPLAGSATAVWLSTLYVPGITIDTATTTDTVRTVVLVAVIIGVVNLIIKPVAKFLTFGLRILTLGLFAIILNGGLLYLVSFAAERFDIPFKVESFWPGAVVGALFIGIATWALNGVGEFILKKRPKTKTVYLPPPPPPPPPPQPTYPTAPQSSSPYAPIQVPPQQPPSQYPPSQYPPR